MSVFLRARQPGSSRGPRLGLWGRRGESPCVRSADGSRERRVPCYTSWYSVPMTYAAPGQVIGVLGAGAWGTVIAWLLANNGHQVRLWARRREHAAAIAPDRVNSEYLPYLPLPALVTPTSDLRAALAGAALTFVVVPSRALVSLMAALPPVAALVSCSKGMEL